MATAFSARRAREIEYPTSDGKPMAETDWHRNLMLDLIETLRAFYIANTNVYVSGNLLIYYERGNKRRHVSPDVFVVRGVRNHMRDYYLLWQERRGPEAVIEVTSKTTRREDLGKKFVLYRDTIKVKEYFLFDPRGDYLDPRLQGYRLRAGNYQPIPWLNGRLPSQVLGLHLERVGDVLRLFEPQQGIWLPTPVERAEQEKSRAEQEKSRAEQEKLRAERAEAEVKRLLGLLDRNGRKPDR